MIRLPLAGSRHLVKAAAKRAVTAAFSGKEMTARVHVPRCFSSQPQESIFGQRLPSSSAFADHPVADIEDELCRKHMELPADEFLRGCQFLHRIALGDLSGTEALCSNFPELINFRDYDRRTGLHVAASEGHVHLVKLLVQQGAKINRSDRWGGSPLDDAHRHRHAEVIHFLKQNGASFGSPSQSNNFITAAAEGDLDEVKALLEFGNVDLNQGDYDARTPLHLAASAGASEVVQFLCDKGANVNAKDRWGNRPLDDARSAVNGEACVQILEQLGGTSSDVMGQEALLDLMHQYGKVRDGTLSLDWHDVKDLLKGVGEEPTDEVVQKLFAVADVEGDGFINSEEFITHSDTFLGGRPARIILVVGGPGSGKGILSERLVKECNIVHLSSGDLLREEVAQGTPLGKQVEEIMQTGGLVSSAIMVSAIMLPQL